MALRMRTSEAGLELIKSFEGFRSRATRMPNGKWIIGYGHTDGARKGLTVTPEDADLLLRHHDLRKVEALIADRVMAPLAQNEFDALVSFAFNLGDEAFLGSSAFALLNSGERLQAADAMTGWRKGRVDGDVRVIDALVRRRAAEKAMFLAHPSGRVAVPGVLLRPEYDPHAAVLISRERPVVIEARTEGDRTTATARGGEAESAPQAAARAVSERITRILEEGDATPAVELEPAADEPTVDEITKAVSALAEPDVPDEPDLPPVQEEPKTPKHTILERRKSARVAPPEPAEPLELTEPVLPRAGSDWDDLEPAPDYLDDREPDIGLGIMRWLPYALLAGLGSWGIIHGVRRWMATPVANRLADPEQAYVGPLLTFGSAMLCLVAIYYLYRAINRRY